MGPRFLHDLSLSYFLPDAWACGDILLADRAFCSHAQLALRQRGGVDSVTRLHQARRREFRRGRDERALRERSSRCFRWAGWRGSAGAGTGGCRIW